MSHKHHTLLLDMDGTLLDLHFDNHFWLHVVPKAYAQAQGMCDAQAMQKLMPYFTDLQGSLNWYCTDYWSELTGLNIVALKTQVQEKIQFLPKVKTSLNALRQHYQRLVIITNAHPDSVALKDRQTQISTLVDTIISAHQLNACKEQPEFWQRLQQQEPFVGADTHFVDDNAQVLHSAYCFGLRHLFFITHPDSQQTTPNAPPEALASILQPLKSIHNLLERQ